MIFVNRLFVKEEEYPKFVRQEIIVNAVTHRSYSISGTDIQVKMFDNRIVVESPGKFPGLVRTDNIRHTHFSRNPRIAEFLKAYNYVKEYGEGVDRMCNELESIGLCGPEYYCNAFMLQTIVYNANIGNLNEKSKKSAIQDEKLAIQILKSAIQKKKYKASTSTNLIMIYEMIDANQIFGTKEIVKILKCAPSTAREIMQKFRELNAVVEVKGKGKYRFRNKDEK